MDKKQTMLIVDIILLDLHIPMLSGMEVDDQQRRINEIAADYRHRPAHGAFNAKYLF